MATIAIDDVVRGDVLLVTRRPEDELADLIMALDASPGRFSHAGVALGDGRILSSYPFPDRLGWPVDLGGLKADEFAHFWGFEQSIHRLTVDRDERALAAIRLDAYDEGPGSFSVPKVVMVAAALHALSPSNPISDVAAARVVRRAIDAATAWEANGDFYCAEFVAHLYKWEFVLGELVPPRWRQPIDVPFLARMGVDLVADILGLSCTEHQKATMYAFIDEARASDPEFFGPRPFATVAAWLNPLTGWLADLTAPDGPVGPVDETPLDLTTPLPSGLVTPRMVRKRHRGAAAPPRVLRPGRTV